MTPNESSIRYRPLEPTNKLLAFFRGDREIKFSQIKGIVYGPFSATFQARKRPVIEAMNFDSIIQRQQTHMTNQDQLLDDLREFDLDQSVDRMSNLANVNNTDYRRQSSQSLKRLQLIDKSMNLKKSKSTIRK